MRELLLYLLVFMSLWVFSGVMMMESVGSNCDMHGHFTTLLTDTQYDCVISEKEDTE